MLATACFRGVTDPRSTTPLGRLGESLTELRANVRVGTHVFVDVDTSQLRAYSVE